MRVQRWRAEVAIVAACMIGLVSSRIALADDPAAEARAAYNLGLVAHDAGDEKTAAREFARADALVPSNEALEAATASALRADDAILGMTLVSRARSRSLDPRATETVERARQAFSLRVATLVVDCDNAVVCSASLDGATAVDAHAPLFVLAGKHVIAISNDKTSQSVNVTAGGGEVVRLVATASTSASAPVVEAEGQSPIARPLAFVAIGATLVLGGFAIASGVDAKSKRNDFERDQCGIDAPTSTSPSADCNQLADSGHSAQTRTNLLIAGTAVAAAATLAFVVVAKPFGAQSHVKVVASLGGVSGALTF